MYKFFSWAILVSGLYSCSSYKQNILLKASDGSQPEIWKKEAAGLERDYVIQRNDLLKLDVYSNSGERLIDPNPELSGKSDTRNTTTVDQPNFLVNQQGIIKFPMVNELKLEGLTLRQAEEILQKQYAVFFKEPFVHLTFMNKRFVILGAPGGQVIPLTNQQVTLAEGLAMAKGLQNDAKAHTIRVVRNEKIYQVDLSTMQGFLQGNMIIEPGDIIYVEPVRRPVTEALKDNVGFVSIIVSLATLIAVISNLK